MTNRVDRLGVMESRKSSTDRTVFVLPRFGPATTGGERYNFEIVGHFRKKGIDTTVLSLHQAPSVFRSNHLLSNLWIAARLVMIRPSLVLFDSYLHSRVLLAMLILRLLGCRMVTICHHLTYHDLSSGLLRKIDVPLEGISFRLANRIITVSEASRREISSLGIPATKIAVVPDAVDRPIIPPRTDEPGGPVRILFAGSCHRRKGLIHLLEAMASLRRHPLRLDIVGDMVDDEEYVRLLRAFAADHELEDKVIFHGRVATERLWQLYGDADVFVLPSLWEGYGIVLLEAMWFGLPIVATNVGAIPELIEDGRNGILASPGDSQQLADALLRLAVSPALRAELGQRGREFVANVPSWDEVGERAYLALAGIRR